MAGKSIRIELGDEVKGMLEDFCAVNYDSNQTEVIRRALRKFIRAELSRDDEKRRDYEKLQATRNPHVRRGIKLVKQTPEN